jgi:hypothetical protein
MIPNGPAASAATEDIAPNSALDVVETRDNQNRLLFEFDPATGRATFYVPGTDIQFRTSSDGKLDIICPQGLRILTGKAIEFVADEGIRVSSQENSCQLTPDFFKIKASNAEFAINDVEVAGTVARVRFGRLTIVADKLQQTVGRLFEYATYAYRRVDVLLHTRARRIRTESTESQLIQADSIRIQANDHVHVQGKSIHLG